MQRESVRQEHIKKTQASILKYMAINDVSEFQLAQKMNVTVKTIQNRIKHPEKMQMEEIWQLASIIKCPICELCGGESPEEITVRIMTKAARELH